MVDYLFIPAKNFSGEVKVTDQDVTAYYDAHKKDFAIPPKVDVAYVSVTPGGLVKPESISEADAQKWYEANKSRFEEPAQVKAAHILVPLAENAPADAEKKAREEVAKIQAELKSGKDFAGCGRCP